MLELNDKYDSLKTKFNNLLRIKTTNDEIIAEYETNWATLSCEIPASMLGRGDGDETRAHEDTFHDGIESETHHSDGEDDVTLNGDDGRTSNGDDSVRTLIVSSEIRVDASRYRRINQCEALLKYLKMIRSDLSITAEPSKAAPCSRISRAEPSRLKVTAGGEGPDETLDTSTSDDAKLELLIIEMEAKTKQREGATSKADGDENDLGFKVNDVAKETARSRYEAYRRRYDEDYVDEVVGEPEPIDTSSLANDDFELSRLSGLIRDRRRELSEAGLEVDALLGRRDAARIEMAELRRESELLNRLCRELKSQHRAYETKFSGGDDGGGSAVNASLAAIFDKNKDIISLLKNGKLSEGKFIKIISVSSVLDFLTFFIVLAFR